MSPRRTAVLAALLSVVVLAACAGPEDALEGDVASEPGGVPATAQESTVTNDSGVTVGGPVGQKPTIELPGGAPPPELVVTDVVEGEGAEAPAGGTVTTHYVGVAWSDGEQFDASWDRGEPISFPLDRVIAGWSQGIPGMREGGRRLLVVPAEQAYANSPPPGSGIGPGETLVFVVDLKAVGG